MRRPRVFVPALCSCVFGKVHLRHGLIAPPAEALALVDGSRPASGRRCATSASAALRLHRDWSGRRRRCRSLQSASSANPSRASRRCAKPPAHRDGCCCQSPSVPRRTPRDPARCCRSVAHATQRSTRLAAHAGQQTHPCRGEAGSRWQGLRRRATAALATSWCASTCQATASTPALPMRLSDLAAESRGPWR